MLVELSQKEKEMIIIGLNMRRNYIETGDVLTSAKDVKNMGYRGYKKINALSTDQMQLIIDTEQLIEKLYYIGISNDKNNKVMALPSNK